MTLDNCYQSTAIKKGFSDWLFFVFANDGPTVDAASLEAFQMYLSQSSNHTEEGCIKTAERNLITKIPENFFFDLAKLRYYQKANKNNNFNHMKNIIKKLETEIDSFLYSNCFEYIEPGAKEFQQNNLFNQTQKT
jgi:hypothetical protein